jgi:RNA polymerase sigma-70 factor (ECF subfamily)
MTAQMDPDLAGAIAAEDMKLMERIAHKDAAAFNQFYRRYGGLLFSTISKVLNDHHDAEDIMQEVMVQLWQKAHLYEPRKGKPLTWLTTMAKNRAIDRIRSKQRRSRLSEEFTSEHHVTQPEFDESGHDILQTKERDTNLRQAVTKLTPDQQQAIKLTYFDGLTQAEVAERLHEPLGTIKARIRRGVTRLEDLMRSKTR